MLPCSYGPICAFNNQSSPSFVRPYASFRLALPARIDLTSVPERTMPVSNLSRRKKLWDAARFTAASRSPAATGSRRGDFGFSGRTCCETLRGMQEEIRTGREAALINPAAAESNMLTHGRNHLDRQGLYECYNPIFLSRRWIFG